jgi:hypothetical protein
MTADTVAFPRNHPRRRQLTGRCVEAILALVALAALAVGCGAGGPGGFEPPVGPVGDAARPPDPPFEGLTIRVATEAPNAADDNPGTADAPLKTVQRAVQRANQANARGQAVRILLGAGVYRESLRLVGGSEHTDAPMVVEGEPGAVLSGADIWTDWQAQPDGSYTSAWPYTFGMAPIPGGWGQYWNSDGNGFRRDILRRSELVFADGAPLRGVLSDDELGPGTFFVDEDNQRLDVRLPDGRSMDGVTMEVTVRRPVLLIDGRTHVTVRHLTVEKGRGAIQEAAVVVRDSEDVTVSDMLVQLNAYNGMATSGNERLVINGSRFDDNGVLGLSGYREKDIILEDTEIARNNWRGWPVGHEEWDSVFKWLSVHGGVARRLRVVDNLGNGFWLDTDNRNVELSESLISGNRKGGVTLEANQGPIAVIANRICDNVEAGILDAQSDHVTLRDNHIFGNQQYNIYFAGDQSGQTATDWETGEETSLNTRYWTVRDNVIAGSGSGQWLWWNTGPEDVWTSSRDTLSVGDNIWYHTRDAPFRLPDGGMGYDAFRENLQRSDSAHESGSVLADPGPLVCRDA